MVQGVRAIESADLAAIAAIESRLFENPTNLETLQALYEKKAFCGFSLGQDASGAVAAYAVFLCAGPSADLVTIGTAPALQRKGFARAVLRHAMEQLAGEGVEELLLEVAQDNEPAIGLYSTLGFTAVAMRSGYYQSDDGPKDAMVMQLQLKKSVP